MTKQEQIYEIAKYVCNACEFKIYGVCSGRQTDVKSCSLALQTAKRIYKAGYRKVPDGAVVITPEERDDEIRETDEIIEERNNLLARVGVLGREVEELKAKLEKIPLAIKQKIMEEDDCELTEREQATLFLDRMGSDLELLHDMVENLDELLGKGINDYIMGRDGVEGLKDMWERSAVMAFADKLKTQLEAKEQHYICMYDWNAHSAVTDCENEVDELLKEYEK